MSKLTAKRKEGVTSYTIMVNALEKFSFSYARNGRHYLLRCVSDLHYSVSSTVSATAVSFSSFLSLFTSPLIPQLTMREEQRGVPQTSVKPDSIYIYIYVHEMYPTAGVQILS